MKIKKLNLIILVIFMLSTVIFGTGARKKTSVPKFVIQYGVNRKFPITRSTSKGNITLRNPKINFKGNKIYLESNYQFSSTGSNSNGKFYVSSDFKYDKQKEVANLVNFSFDSIVDKNGMEIKNSVVGKDIENFVMNEIKKYLTYDYGSKYNKKNRNKTKKKEKIKDMYIENGKFYIES